MKNILTNIGILAIVGVSALATSCRESFDYEEAYRANPEFVYRENFEKAFGKIDPNQSWDFTSSTSKYVLTRGTDDVESLTRRDDIEISASPGQACKNNLSEGSNNSGKGQPYTIQSKGNFLICPVYHGNCEVYNLIVEGCDVDGNVVCSYKITSQQINAGMKYADESTASTTNYATNPVNPINGAAPWVVPIQEGLFVKLYLEVAPDASKGRTEWTRIPYDLGNGAYSSLWATSSALTNQNALHNNTKPYVGIILFNDSNNDKDYNDLCVLVATFAKDEDVPDIITGDTTREYDNIVEKRYMVEDLGAVDNSDIDFNDIVIDLSQTKHVKDYYTNGQFDREEILSTTQNAEVIALGGTLNIAVVVGGKQIFQKQGNYDVKSMYQTGDPGTEGASWSDYSTNVMKEIDLSTTDFNNPWVPSENNITVLVEGNEGSLDGKVDLSASNAVRSINFPADGTLPFMVATPVTQKFNAEKCSVLEAGSADLGYHFYLGGQ